MIYTLFVWTVIAATPGWQGNPSQKIYDWRSIATIEYTHADRAEGAMLGKCQDVAKQLGYTTERYRCVRTK